MHKKCKTALNNAPRQAKTGKAAKAARVKAAQNAAKCAKNAVFTAKSVQIPQIRRAAQARTLYKIAPKIYNAQ